MKKRWRMLLAAFTVVLACTCLFVEPGHVATKSHDPVFTTRTLVRGSSGTDVRELQGRLKHIGYYKGNIDGSYGWSTYWAVRNFQYRFGMKVDGKVGANTREKLVKASRGYNPWAQGKSAPVAHASGYSNPTALHTSSGGHYVSYNDKRLLANAVYGEARGESYMGQVAIAAVILNRLDSPLFPHTVPGIIFQPGAFTAVQDGQIYLTPNQAAVKAVNDAINGWDPSSGAIYYFNPATATSKWIWGRPQIKRIGRHIFCR
ncbi:MAG: spore cortex-lytic enzyme [Tumebacillaceae bacterium]